MKQIYSDMHGQLDFDGMFCLRLLIFYVLLINYCRPVFCSKTTFCHLMMATRNRNQIRFT